MTRRMRGVPAALLALALAAAPGAAQAPDLPEGADRNDWESWFDLGQSVFVRFPEQARAAFDWAARLDPTRAEPQLGRWAATYMADPGLFSEYVSGRRDVMTLPKVVRTDSLLGLAYTRNPFAHRGLEAALYAAFTERSGRTDVGSAFLEYGRGDFDEAADRFGSIARHRPRDPRVRFYRALALVGAEQTDSAAAEVQGILDMLRAEEERELTGVYASKAGLEYALGRLHEARGDTAQARGAFERALVEELSYHPARQGLGRLALRAGNPAEAVEQLSAAATLAPRDGVVRWEHGNALLAAGRTDDAVAEYREALDLEPFWAEAYLRLAVAYDQQGRLDRAAVMYRAYLERAPGSHGEVVVHIRTRLAELEAQGIPRP